MVFYLSHALLNFSDCANILYAFQTNPVVDGVVCHLGPPFGTEAFFSSAGGSVGDQWLSVELLSGFPLA